MVTNVLTQARRDVKDALKAAGITALDYVAENIIPPVAVVIPAEQYLLATSGNTYGEPYSVGMHVLLIGSKGSNEASSERLDSMIVDAVNALDGDWDITEVTAPKEVSLKGTVYGLGSVITLETNTSIERST